MALLRSEDPFWLGVDLFERCCSALIENCLCGEALIFIVVVCVHAVSKLFHLIFTELLKDGLARGALILSGETKSKSKSYNPESFKSPAANSDTVAEESKPRKRTSPAHHEGAKGSLKKFVLTR